MQRQILTQALTSYLPSAANALLAFLLIPWILHYAGPEEYAVWTLMGIVIALMLILDFGMSVATIRFTASLKGEERNTLLSTILASYFSISACALPLLLFALLFLGSFSPLEGLHLLQGQKVLMILGLVTLCVQLPCTVFRGILIGTKRIGFINLLKASTIFFNLGLCWILLRSGAGVIGVATASATAISIESIIQISACFWWNPDLRMSWRHITRERLQEVLGFSAYQFLVNLMFVLYLQMDVIIISYFFTLDQVTVYAIALKVSTQCLMLSKGGINTLTPYFASLHAEEKTDELRELFIRSASLALAAASILTVLIATCAPAAFKLWLGPSYQGSAIILLILSCATPALYVLLPAASLLHMTQQHRYATLISVSSTTLNVLGSILLLQVFGLMGVAYATLGVVWVWELPMMMRRCLAVIECTAWQLVLRTVRPLILPTVAALTCAFIGQFCMSEYTASSLSALAALTVLAFAASYYWGLRAQANRSLRSNEALTQNP